MTNKEKNTSASSQHSSQVTNGIYEIKVKGHLDDHWKPWFAGMILNYETAGEPEEEYTLITGPIVDQPALHGLLAKIRDLNLTLISVRRISLENSDGSERNQIMLDS
jgi:hypothetical protein